MTNAADAITAALAKMTPGEWRAANMVHEAGRPMTPEEIGEYVCNSVKAGVSGRFLFIGGKHEDGGDADICHIGNGPRGPANAAGIVTLRNRAAELVAAYEREKARADAAEVVVRQAIIDDLSDLYQRRVMARKGKRPNNSDQVIYAVIQRIAGVDPTRAALTQERPHAD